MLVWVIFGVIIVVSFVADVGLFSSRKKPMSIKQAMYLCMLWVLIALIFNFGLYVYYGTDVALQFLASYILEKGLSIDNVFVFYIIFENFEIPEKFQRRVLQWGIIGALFMRALFILTGIKLLQQFHFVIFFFGAFLVYTGINIFYEKDDDEPSNFQDKWWARLFLKFIPYDDNFADGSFFTGAINQKPRATRLFFALVTVELMDAVFALDSIPAILSLTNDPLVVYTSNIFAILGLRALYFAISGMVNQFYFLKFGLGVILVFVGIKMLLSHFYNIPLVAALLFILMVMVSSVLASLLFQSKSKTSENVQDNVVSV